MNAREHHLATRHAAGQFDFSFIGLYEFPDIASVQQFQTRNLEALAPGQIAYTLLLNDDGSVFNDATVWRLPNGRWWLFTGRPGDFARFQDEARDRSGEYAILALQGPESGQILSQLIGRDAVIGLKYFRFIEQDLMIVARLGYSGELGYELLVPAARGPRLRQTLLDQGVPECSFDAANSLRIESGYVLFDREIDGRANPRELSLERLVSGRRDFAVTRRLVGLEILDRPARADVPGAHVTSECFSPIFGRQLALGFAAPEVNAGDRVRLGDGRSAGVARLPFYDPGKRLPRAVPL